MSGKVRRSGPQGRADESHPTRHQLLDAAIGVADRNGLSALSVSDVTTAAGVAKGTFYVHFPDRTTLLVEIHRRFHDDLFDEVTAACDGLLPGLDRARRRIEAYLDGCSGRPGVRGLLLGARGEPAIAAEEGRQNDIAATALAEDLRHDSPTGHELETARLIVAAAAETASIEQRAGQPQPRLRAALATLLAT